VVEDEEILSAELVFSTPEIIAEFFERCEESARTHDTCLKSTKLLPTFAEF
jgi:hypothetical protein